MHSTIHGNFFAIDGACNYLCIPTCTYIHEFQAREHFSQIGHQDHECTHINTPLTININFKPLPLHYHAQPTIVHPVRAESQAPPIVLYL